MKKKTKTYRCGWKLEDVGYTLEEAEVIKAKLDCQNGFPRDKENFEEAEILEDPRGGYMVRCTEL